jgi:hypothetical protein
MKIEVLFNELSILVEDQCQKLEFPRNKFNNLINGGPVEEQEF